jgi:TolA-binding protein
MKFLGKIFLALLLFVFAGTSEAATEWVKLVTDDAKGNVVAISGDSYTIDVGMSLGARSGGLYLVYVDGQSEGQKTPVAILKVRQTASEFSLCSIKSSGADIRIGDKVTPVSAKAVKKINLSSARPSSTLPQQSETEGYISQNNDGIYYQVETIRAAVHPETYTVPAQPGGTQVIETHTQVVAPEYNGYATYPPYPNYSQTSEVMLDFDANKIADARLIRTFPLSQPDMNALEIEYRAAWQLYNKRRYAEAQDAYARQTSYNGNYLSPYWAGLSALKLGDKQAAISWFNRALGINPYFEPARNAILKASEPAKPAQPKATTRRRRARRK